MKKRFTPLLKLLFGALMLGLPATVQAGYVPIVLTGYNTDVVASGTGAANALTTYDVDGSAGAGYVFMAQNYVNPSGASPTTFLPNNGSFTSAALSGLPFQLADYTTSNSLRLPATGNSGTASGTLTFVTPQAAGEVYILATSGGGGSTATFTVNFSDGTTEAFANQAVPDWYATTGTVALSGFGRVSRTAASGIDNNSTNPRLYQIKLALSAGNYAKNISSITVAKTSTGTGAVNVMGVTINTPCAGTPTGGTTLASVGTVCSGTSSVLSLSGATTDVGIGYQWQRNTSGTWSDISGATAATYTVSGQLVATQYRAKLTCSASGLFDYSAPVTVAQNPFYNCYCTPNSTGTNEYINSVALNTLSNVTNANSTNGYGDFTTNSALTTTLNQGATYTVTLGIHANNTGSQAGIWIDYDHNGAFDASEYLAAGGANASNTNVTLISSLAVPAGAQLGQTRMRVRWRNGAISSTDACTTNPTTTCTTGCTWFGETEDYLISIAASTACTGAPAAGTATATTAAACTNSPFTLSATGYTAGATGISFQWQSSPAGANTFTNLGAAQTAVAYTVANQTAATDYQLVVTCTNGGQSATSTVVSVGQNSVTNCYCQPTSSSGGEYLTNVTLNGLNNTSGSSTTNATVGFADYTGNAALTTTLNLGSSYPVSVSAVDGRINSQALLWIDYDHSGTFDASEYLLVGSGPTFGTFPQSLTFTNTINVPSTALAGTTRLRVRWHNDNNSTDPCGLGWNGETEDYLITLAAPVACAGTPPVGTAVASVSAACQNTTFTLSVTGLVPGTTGLSYQWQSSPTGANTYANLGTAQTTTTYNTTGQPAAADYRVLVTCTASGISTPSNPVTVSQSPYLGCYDAPVSTGTNEYIRVVSFGGTNGFTNTSNANAANGYADYTANTALTATVNPSVAYPLGLTVRSNNGGSQGGVWIDYNHSGTFDASEYTFIGTANVLDPATFSITLTIPATAQLGQTRMRVRWRNGAIASTDGSTSGAAAWFGETEDYLISIVSPLPVELISFVAEATGPTVRLAWATASEKNSDRFEVERSFDGRTYARIGTVTARGNAVRQADYAFVDDQPTAPGLHYYRLRQVDTDGSAEYSPVRAVQVGKATALALYPNPAHRAVLVSGVEAGAAIDVFDALGRPVLRSTADAAGSAQLALPAHLPAGMYVVRSGTQARRLAVE